jgi:hypothetical protein
MDILLNTQHFIKTHINIIIFDIFGRTVPLRDLRISDNEDYNVRGLLNWLERGLVSTQ